MSVVEPQPGEHLDSIEIILIILIRLIIFN
jgi:hypothetical protein